MQINVSIHLNLGRRLIRVGDKVLGACDGVVIQITAATPEELIELKNAQVIELVKLSREEPPKP